MTEEKKCKNKPAYKRWWFWVVIGFAIIIFISATYNQNQEKLQSGGTPDTSETEITQPDTSESSYIDAYDIIKDYVDNTVVADTKYRNKTLEIQGVVNDIGKDLIDVPFLTLRGSKFTFQAMRCNFSKADEPILANVFKNQEIVVRGKIAGEKLGTVLVTGCEIVK